MDRIESSRPFLIIGCGSIGKRHLGNLIELGVENLLAFDVSRTRLDDVQASYDVETLEDLEKALARKPFAAFVNTPTSLHIPTAIRAAEQGCHLFIEKPLSHSLESIERLINIVREKNLITLVGCNMRFHPGLRLVKELLGQKAIGNVVAARIEAGQYLPDWHPQEDYRKNYSASRELGGGVILDAIHELDYVRWLLGEVRALACFAGRLSHLEIETEDTAAVLLRFVSGVIGEVHVDYVQRTYSRTCHIIGDQGTIRWDYSLGLVRCFRATSGQWHEFSNPPGWVPNQMYKDEMQHFLRCLKGEEQPAQDVKEASRVLQIALAAKSSERLGQVEKL